jgi:hypothetical protein
LFNIGGFSIFLSLLSLSYLYEPYSFIYISLISCSFDTSAIVFLIYYKFHQYTQFNSNLFFFVYQVFPLIGLVGSFFLLNNLKVAVSHENIKTNENIDKINENESIIENKKIDKNNEIENIDDKIDEVDNENIDDKIDEIKIKDENEIEEKNQNEIPNEIKINLITKNEKNEKNSIKNFFTEFFKQIINLNYFYFLIIFSIHSLNIILFLSNLNLRISTLSNGDIQTYQMYIEIFSWILPIVSFFSGPIVGFFIF